MTYLTNLNCLSNVLIYVFVFVINCDVRHRFGAADLKEAKVLTCVKVNINVKKKRLAVKNFFSRKLTLGQLHYITLFIDLFKRFEIKIERLLLN